MRRGDWAGRGHCLDAMVDRETFDRIKARHGRYASWAVWSEPDGKPKSNMGDLTASGQRPSAMQRRHHVLQPDRDHPPVLGERVTGTGQDRVQRHKRLL